MPEIPECLNRRYLALDELIQELSALVSQGTEERSFDEMITDPGIKLMCDFWNILKENPECDLSQAVKQRMGVRTPNSLYHQNVSCFMADKSSKSSKDYDTKREARNKIKNTGCSSKSSPQPSTIQTPMKSKSRQDVASLSKVLDNLKEAASFDKKCNSRIKSLMETQKDLQAKTQYLEHREEEGIQLLKEADCMWSSMEESYKKKIAESLERQNELLLELKEIEKSKSKWRKNKKDLESQMNSITKYHQEVAEKIAQKQNDVKCMNIEIENFKQKIENNKLIAAGSKKVISNKTEASEKKIASIADEVTKLQTTLENVQKQKRNKEQEGQKYVKDARNDLQKICRVLLQKKLENEKLQAETETLDEEINFLKQSSDQSQGKCNMKQNILNEEIKKINKYIAEYQAKCTRCNQSIDTDDVRKLCNDCPRCKEENESRSESENRCDKHSAVDCVCTNVKEKFLGNVFENMYTVLEKQSKTAPGKAVADAMIKSLKNSRTGKLDTETRQLIQTFVLDTVSKNTNLTIVGGAVKTRCEMDPDIYQQLMLCLKQEKGDKPLKADKGTVAKKACCNRWGGTSECNCPGGANSCACAERAPPQPPSKDENSPIRDKENVSDPTEKLIGMAHPDSQSTGYGQTSPDNRDNAMHAVPSAVGTDVASRKPDSAAVRSPGPISKMRTAQCILGSEILSSSSKACLPPGGELKSASDVPDSMVCRCEKTPTKRCRCIRGRTNRPREKIIEEVMGRHSEITPIETQRPQRKKVMMMMMQKEDKIKNDNSTSPTNEDHSVNDIDDHGYLIEKEIVRRYSKNVPQNAEHKAKHLPSVTSESTVYRKFPIATALGKTTRDTECQNKRISFQTRKERKNSSESVITVENTQSGDPVIILDTPSDILDVHRTDQVTKKPTEDFNFKARNKSSLEHLDDDYFVNNSHYSTERIIIRTNPSSTRLFELKNSFNNSLPPHDLNNEFKAPETTKTPAVISISQKQPEEIQFRIKHKKNRLKPTENNINERELQLKYDQNATICVKIEKASGVYKVIEARITKTLSGNMAIDIENYSDDVEMTSKEHAVLIKRSNSGAIIINDCRDGLANAVIRKTASGSLLLVVTNPVFQTMKTKKTVLVPKERFYKVKVKTANDDLAEPPALLKQTQSYNYIFVPDKEYENRYKQTLRELLEDCTEYYVNMRRTDSENFVLNFDDIDGENEPNALVVKNESEDIKVITTKKKSVSTNMEWKKPTIGTTSKLLDELINKLPRTSKQNRKSLLAPMLSTIQKKPSSDTNMYEKIKLLYSDHKDVLEVPSTILKMTSLGQHAVVLDKESKNTFMKNLERYLKKNFDSLVPFKKSNNGEITIDLTSEHNKSHYGSLKITPSGNLYVVVDKELVKDISKEPTKTTNTEKEKTFSATNTMSRHIIEMLENPVNKAVTTTCNRMPDDSCDVTTCACPSTQIKNIDRVDHTKSENNMIFSGIDSRNVRSNLGGSFNDENTQKYSSQIRSKRAQSANDKPSQWEPSNNSNAVKVSDSNSTLEILSFLPLQLPAFLKGNGYP